MASLLETLAALATAGTMMISSSLDAAAPQNDVDGFFVFAESAVAGVPRL